MQAEGLGASRDTTFLFFIFDLQLHLFVVKLDFKLDQILLSNLLLHLVCRRR